MYRQFLFLAVVDLTIGLCRGVAKLVKAPDFDSGMRGFESFLPCQTVLR